MRSTPLYNALMRVTEHCARYYGDDLDDDQKRAIIQDIWRTANFAIMSERARRRKTRAKKPKKPDGRLRSPAYTKSDEEWARRTGVIKDKEGDE